MTLSDIKQNSKCKIVSVNILDELTKIRIMELGLVEGTIVVVKNRSLLKKTMLIAFQNSCFTIKENIAQMVAVEYA